MYADSSVNNALSPPGDLKIGTIIGNTIRDCSFGVFPPLLRGSAVARFAWGFAVRHETAPGTRVSPFHHNAANAVTRAVSSAVRVRGPFRSSAHFRPWWGSLLPHRFNSSRDPRHQRPPLSLVFFTFPSLLQLGRLPPPSWSPRSLTHSTNSKGGKGPYVPILKVTLGGLDSASDPVFPPRTGIANYSPSCQQLNRPHNLATAQAHLVFSNPTSAFSSPRRPRKQ